MTEWTKEPWRVCLLDCRIVEAGDGLVVADVHGDEHAQTAANAERLVSCVNALTDRDPAALAELERAVEALKCCMWTPEWQQECGKVAAPIPCDCCVAKKRLRRFRREAGDGKEGEEE